MRSRFPALRTLPSSTVATLSFDPTSARSIAGPRNANDEVRAATRKPGSWVRALMISSAMPSLKYSNSGSPLRFANGKTAIDSPPSPSVVASSRVVKAAANWAAVANRARDGQLPLALQTATQRLAFDVRHHVIEQVLSLTRIVQREDVRVVQSGRGGDLTQEALDAEARGELGMKHLDRNRSLVLQVDRQKNRRHPAATDCTIDRVAVLEAGLQASEECGQTSLLTPRPKDSEASATPGVPHRTPHA